MNRTRLFACFIVAALAVSLASCGGGGSTTPTTSGNASVRFINGSPDVGAIDVLVNGKVVVSNLTYGQISSFQTIGVGTTPLPQVAFVKTGTLTNIFPPLTGNQAQTFQLGAVAGSVLTVVVEGLATQFGSRGLTLGSFIEPVVTNTGNTYTIVFHHASPAGNLASPQGLYVGQIAFGSPNVYTALGVMLFSSTSGSANSFFGLSNQGAVTGPPGIGFWVGPVIVATATPVPVNTTTATPTPTPTATSAAVPSPTVYAAIVPGPPVAIPSPGSNSFPVIGVDSANVNQVLPYPVGTETESSLFVYVIDSTTSPTGVTLVGTFANTPSSTPSPAPT
jgi:hypothetical protein